VRLAIDTNGIDLTKSTRWLHFGDQYDIRTFASFQRVGTMFSRKNTLKLHMPAWQAGTHFCKPSWPGALWILIFLSLFSTILIARR